MMQRVLARSVLGPIARCSALARRAGTAAIASDSTWSSRRPAMQDEDSHGRGVCSSTISPRPPFSRANTAVQASGGKVLCSRSFSSSITRLQHESKDKHAPNSLDAPSAPTDKGQAGACPNVSIAGRNDSEQAEDAQPSTSFEPASTPHSQDSSTSVERDTNTTSSSATPQPTILDRLRSATSSLPKFDGLASTAALSQALETATARTRTFTSTLRTKLSTLSAQYNAYSGYTAIEELKLRISRLETELDSKRELGTIAKKTYLSAVQNRSASQRETNDLLSRKNSWSEADLGRYTELLRKEHALSRQEAQAEKELERSEAEVQVAFDELMKAVMMRYHEEQIWSDRMRGMSTYGSLVVAGLNAFLFILAILLVEPYKRKKLAQTFESRLVAAEEQSRQLILASVDQFQHSLNAAFSPTPTPIPTTTATATATATTETPPPLLTAVDEPPVSPQPEEQPAPIIEPQPELPQDRLRRKREEEERLVFASTVGVVVGAALSLLISACWS